MVNDSSRPWSLSILNYPIEYNDLEVTFLDFFEVRHDSGFSTTPHRHPYYEFCYLESGTYFTTIKNNELMVEPNNFLIIPPDVEHSNRCADENYGFCARWLLKKRDEEPDYRSRRVADDIIHATTNCQIKGVHYPANWIMQYVNNESIPVVETTFVSWLMCLCQELDPLEKGHKKEETEKDKQTIVSHVLQFLETNYASEFAVKDIADSLGYSYRHIARVFKETTDIHITAKLNALRIKKSIELLESTFMTVKEISKAVGFKNESYFSLVFSEHTHLSPTKYRKRVEENNLWVSG